MKVQHIIDDLESVFSKQPETKDYDVAFACYSEDGSGSIEIDYVEGGIFDTQDRNPGIRTIFEKRCKFLQANVPCTNQ